MGNRLTRARILVLGWVIFAIAVGVSFQNCSPMATPNTKLFASGGPGGYDGKPSYSYNNPDQTCPYDGSHLISRLIIDGDTASFVRINCVDVNPPQVIARGEWKYAAEDNSVILYHGQNFVLDGAFDPCSGRVPGEACVTSTAKPSGLYVGKYQGRSYMMTPPGCSDSPNPTCSGTDEISKPWGAVGVYTEANSADGLMNSWILDEKYPDAEAAKYCRRMNYGGYSDWYLPSVNEVIMVFSPNQLSFPGLYWADGTAVGFWTSSELMAPSGPDQGINSQFAIAPGVLKDVAGKQLAHIDHKSQAHNVRCMRRY